MLDKQGIYALLKEKGIAYEVTEHAPVYTIEGMEAEHIPHMNWVMKNLFLRNSNKSQYYLVVMPGHKKLDLKKLKARMGSTNLSFAKEDALLDMLGLERGAVTPLGLLNNEACDVTAVFDEKLPGKMVGIHPLENTATVFMAFDDLLRLVKEHGNPIVMCNLDGM